METHIGGITTCVEKIVGCLKSVSGTIYMTGIGKSAHVVRKCVATWQSLSIPAQFLLAQDLLHGDIGILRPDDILIYVSHSGSTSELLQVASHVRAEFPVKQMSVSNNPDAALHKLVDFKIVLSDGPIQEADLRNKVPTVSCVLFMIALDMVGILLSEERNFTDAEFRKNHPNGNVHNR